MSKKGENLEKHLENLQHEMSFGFTDCYHKYSHNGTISCMRCDKIQHA